MKIKYSIFLFICLILCQLEALSACIVSGKVMDKSTQEPLVGVYVLDTISKLGSVTDTDGQYSFEIPCSKISLRISYVGYETISVDTIVNASLTINFLLAEGIQLDETVVTAQQQAIRENVSKAQMGKMEIPIEQIKKLPVFLGELDILKSIQLLPGIQSGSEASAGFYVRGGASDQNLILYDGVPVYNPFHAAGFLSIFNMDVISDATVYKGGFPAQYGGRISSVMDVSIRNGNMEQWKFQGGIGLVTSRISAEGPIIKDKLSFLGSFRAFYSYSMMRAFFPSSRKSDLPVYYFYDLNLKLHYKINQKQSFSLSYYSGADRIAFNDFDLEDSSKYNIPWRNFLLSAKWQYLIKDNLSLKTQVYYTRYNFTFGFQSNKADYTLNSGIDDVVASSELKWKMNGKHALLAGMEAGWHKYQPNVNDNDIDSVEDDSIPPKKSDIPTGHLAAFVQHEWTPNSTWAINSGLRIPIFLSKGVFYVIPEPRVTIKYQYASHSSLKIGYSFMSQFVNLLANSTASTPLDLWVPASDTIRPQLAHQVAAGWFRNFKNDTYESSVEVFYKHLQNQIEYKEGESIFQADNYEDIITFGKGWSAGAEFFLRKRYGRFNGFAAYTLAWSRRQYDLVNLGEWFNAKFDRRHDFSLALNYQFNKNWSFSTLFVFGSGNSLSLPQGKFFIPSNTFNTGNYYLDYTKNSYRLRSYHRLDIGLQYVKEKKKISNEFRVDIYNVYSRLNPFFVVLVKDEDVKTNQKKYFLREYSILPIVPSFTYNLKFK